MWYGFLLIKIDVKQIQSALQKYMKSTYFYTNIAKYYNKSNLMWTVKSYEWIDADYHIKGDVLCNVNFKINKNQFINKQPLQKQSI